MAIKLNTRAGVPTRLAAAVALLLGSASLQAQENPNLFELSLEELVNLEVTSASRRAERLAETTSAVYVVTRDDMLRYGINSVPEALRLVPGLSVLQIDANKWAVGSRGFVGRFANKLLVLMDGRVLYTPSFSGVFWDVQDTLLEDVARIEVIRGPGSAVWGSNAVNGVINIITRSADEDPGGRVLTRVESDGGYVAAARFGAVTDGGMGYRVFLKHHDLDGNHDPSGAATADGWDLTRAGLRADWSPTEVDHVTISSEAYGGTMGGTLNLATVAPPYAARADDAADVSGMFVVGSWSREHSAGASSALQLTLDSTDRESMQFAEARRTMTVDYQYQRSHGRHDLVLGSEFRHDAFDIAGSPTISMPFPDESTRSLSAFVQDQFSIVPDKLRLTFGTKIEHNALSNREIDLMPSVRALWQVNPDTSVWGAVTRAIRTPSFADLGARVVDVDPVVPPGGPSNPFPLPLRFAALGNPSFVSEEMLAYELGLRGRLAEHASYDLAVYYMDYESLRAYLPGGVVCNPSGQSVLANPACMFAADSVITQIVFDNAGSGEVRGLELALDWDISDRWRLRSSYTYADESQRATPPSRPSTPASGPKHQASLRSEWSLGTAAYLTAWIRYVDEIPNSGIEEYWQANLQVTWAVSDHWRLSIGGQNLLDDSGVEYYSELNDLVPTEIERRAFVRAEWSF
jgi:iron complex outermembrane receptor protein